MVAPFDAAWSVLKGLPEQQIDERYTTHLRASPGLMEALPNQGMGYGTMHPAIQGMLARRGTADGSYPDGSYRYDGGGQVNNSMVQRRRGSAVDPRTSQYELSERMRLTAQNPYLGGKDEQGRELIAPPIENPNFVGFAMPDRQYPAHLQ